MKKIYFSTFTVFCLFASTAFSQHVAWLQSTPVNWNLNPAMPQQLTYASGNKIFAGRMVNGSFAYGVAIYGDHAIDCYDTTGSLLWTFSLGPKSVLEQLAADAAGNLVAAGRYMETVHFNGTDSMVNTGTGY